MTELLAQQIRDTRLCACGHLGDEHAPAAGACRNACGCRDFRWLQTLKSCGHLPDDCRCPDFSTQCPQCGEAVEPSEAEPGKSGVFAVYDHCGQTWTQGFDRPRTGAPRVLVAPRAKRGKLPFRKVWDRDNWQCVTCGTHKNLTVDHIIPVSKGGTDDLANLQTMCGSCNSSKGARV